LFAFSRLRAEPSRSIAQKFDVRLGQRPGESYAQAQELLPTRYLSNHATFWM
jgi:hypothetical protein